MAEMAFAGELGAKIALDAVPHKLGSAATSAALLFSESNSRFLCEVRPGAIASSRRRWPACRTPGWARSPRHNGSRSSDFRATAQSGSSRPT